MMRPLQNTPFCPISVSRSNYNPRNIQYIPPVKIFAFLELEQNWAFFKGLMISDNVRFIKDIPLPQPYQFTIPPFIF